MRYPKSYYEGKLQEWLNTKTFEIYFNKVSTNEQLRLSTWAYFYGRPNKSDKLQPVAIRLTKDRKRVEVYEYYPEDITVPVGVYNLEDYKSTSKGRPNKENETEKVKPTVKDSRSDSRQLDAKETTNAAKEPVKEEKKADNSTTHRRRRTTKK